MSQSHQTVGIMLIGEVMTQALLIINLQTRTLSGQQGPRIDGSSI